MNIYCKNCKKHTDRTHPKKLVLISDKKAKAKSKCAKFLIDRTFFDKINDAYDLEQLVKHFLFTDVFYKRTWRLIVQSANRIKNLSLKIFKTKNSRLIMQSKCAQCGFKKSRFVKEQEVKRLLSNLGIKTPLSKIPLLNVLRCIKINEIVNKFLPGGDKFTLKMYLKQPGVCRQFTINKERIKKITQAENTDFIYKSKLD